VQETSSRKGKKSESSRGVRHGNNIDRWMAPGRRLEYVGDGLERGFVVAASERDGSAGSAVSAVGD
jgi:hypothetical protein